MLLLEYQTEALHQLQSSDWRPDLAVKQYDGSLH